MVKKLTPKQMEIALEVGGSHYPTVGGEYVGKTIEVVVNQCLEVLEQRSQNWLFDDAALEARRCATAIKQHFGLE